jgi:hypothetical protein
MTTRQLVVLGWSRWGLSVNPELVLGILLLIQGRSSVLSSDPQPPPPDSVEQAIGEAYRWLIAGNLRNLVLHLSGFGAFTLLSKLSKPIQQICFLFRRKISPAAPTPPSPLQPVGTQAVILANPQPYGLLGYDQQAGDTMGRERTRDGHPNSCASLVLLAAFGLSDPCFQLLFGQPWVNISGSPHNMFLRTCMI